MIHLSTLGVLAVRNDHGHDLVSVLTQPKRLALLIYLAADGARSSHRRDAVVSLFWPESDSEHAYRALRQALYFLRRELGEDVFTKRGDEEVGVDASHVVCDVQLFRAAIDRGDYRQAASLYRGPFLDAFGVRDAPEFERWVDGVRADLQRQYADALRALAREEEARGDASAAAWWRKLVELDPYNSEYTIGLMRELAESGDPAGALRLADAHAVRLMRDWGIDASPELRQAAEQIRDGGIRVGVGRPYDQQSVPSTNRPGGSAGPGPSPSKAHRSRWRRAGIVGVLGVAGLVTAWRSWLDRITEPAVCDVCVAVFPLALTGPDSLEVWRAGAALLLNQDLDGAGQIRTVDHNAIAGAVDLLDTSLDPASASLIAREWGSWYVLGNLLALGDRNRVTATLYRIDNPTPIASAVAEGTGADMPRLTKQLAGQFIQYLPLGDGQRLANPPQRTENYEALKAYLQGEDFVRRKEFDSASAAFEQAIALDTTFGLPRYRRVGVEAWAGATRGRVAAEAAYPYRGQLVGMDSLLFEATYAFQVGHAEEADRIATSLVSRYPSSVEALWLKGATQLWFSWRIGRPMSSARPYVQRALTLDPHHTQSQLYWTWMAAQDGDVAEFEVSQVNPYASDLYWDRVYQVTMAFQQGDTFAQDSLLALMREDADWVVNLIALSAATSGWFQDLTMVSRVSELQTDASHRLLEARLLGWLRLSQLEVAQGRWRQATDRLDSAALIAPAVSLVYRAWFNITRIPCLSALETPRGREESSRSWTPIARKCLP